jgi:hypothetical protein
MTATTTARVDLLTAEVRVLMVGSRQITLSVYRQLDWAHADEIIPFGRVNTLRLGEHPFGRIPELRDDTTGWVEVVGVSTCVRNAGALVRSCCRPARHQAKNARSWRDSAQAVRQGGHVAVLGKPLTAEECDRRAALGDAGAAQAEEWAALPLIVLAGLR